MVSSDSFQPEDLYTIADFETLKVASDSLRIRIMEAMGMKPVTVRAVAEKLGVSPKKLYYHINLLEQHGLIVVVDTQVVSGIIEKWYQIRAKSFTVDKSLLTVIDDPEQRLTGLDILLDTLLNTTADDIRQAAREGLINSGDPESDEERRSLFVRRTIVRLNSEQRLEFTTRLGELIDQYDDERPGSEDGSPYGLTIAFYPMSTLDDDLLTEEENEDE